MKRATIASILVCLTCCAPIISGAAESEPIRTEAVQNQPETQTGSKTKSNEGAATKLEEVVVTATRVPTPAKELPVPVQVISRKDIEGARANDLSEVLTEYLPEHFQKYPGALTSVSIRGFRSDTTGVDIKGHVLILIDGHRAGTGNIAAIPLDNVERIEIVRGPGSVVYGSAAMGGVVNIITRKGKGDPSLNAGMEYGNWNYFKGRGGFSGSLLDNRVGVSLTGRTIARGSYESGGGTKISNTAYNDEAFSGSIAASVNPDHSLFAVGHYFRAWDIGTPNPTYMTPDLVDTKDILRGYGSLGYDGAFPDWGMNWHLSYYNVFDQNRWRYPEAAYGYTSATTEQQTQGIRTQATFPTLSFGRLLVGFDWDGIDVNSYTNPAGYPWSPNSTYNNYAFFAEEKIDWNKLTLLLGIRYDLFQEEILPTEGLDVRQENRDFGHTSWRTGLTYRFVDWLSGRAAVGNAFTIPSADELAGRYQSGQWMKIVGNPDLKPESGITYEAGLDAEFAGFKTGIGFFYTDYSDKITGGFPTCVDGDCTWTTYRNVEGAILSAIEGSISYKKAFTLDERPLTLRPYMNFVYYTQRELEDATLIQTLNSATVPYVPVWDATAGIEVNYDRKWTLLFGGFYTGDEKQQNFNYLSPTYNQAMDKGGFVVLSAKLSYRPAKFLEIYLASDNLTNRDYAFVDGYPMPGRSVRIGFEARY
ncbi:MAG: TonB-dependent receptor [Desulfobacteraceae bacterium]|nr:TonB-dependent receptor [Desulfobacteraceae bacterium]